MYIIFAAFFNIAALSGFEPEILESNSRVIPLHHRAVEILCRLEGTRTPKTYVLTVVRMPYSVTSRNRAESRTRTGNNLFLRQVRLPIASTRQNSFHFVKDQFYCLYLVLDLNQRPSSCKDAALPNWANRVFKTLKAESFDFGLLIWFDLFIRSFQYFQKAGIYQDNVAQTRTTDRQHRE